MPESVPQYELLLDDQPDVQRGHPVARGGWRRVAVVTLAFVLGVAIGVAATVKQRDAAASRARESALSLTVVAAGWPNANAESERVQVAFRVLNDGPLPLRMESASVEFPGFAPGDAGVSSRVIEPAEWGHVIAWTGDADCDGGAGGGGHGTAVLSVRLASGELREVREPIESGGVFAVTEVWSQICQLHGPEAGVFAYLSSSSDVLVDASGDLVVPGQLLVEFGGGQELTVADLAGTAFIDVRSVDPLGPIVPGQTVHVQFAVRECPRDDQLAEALQMPFTIALTHGATKMEIPVDAFDPSFMAQIVELFHRVCSNTR